MTCRIDDASVTFTVMHGGEVFAPEALGVRDILLYGERIVAVGDGLTKKAEALGPVETIDARGLRVVPGFIDQHLHFLGGGDFEGPLGRVPEIQVSWVTAGGITTAVGIMGIDMEMKNLYGLMVKAHELERQGLSTYVYTGSMRIPSPYLTSSIRADLVLFEKCLGVKVALSENTYPNLSLDAFAQLAGEVRLAAGISGKPCVIHAHIGRHPKGLKPIFDLLEVVDLPPHQIVPTHVNRHKPGDTFADAIELAKRGVTIDFSCNLSERSGSETGMSPEEAVKRARAAGVPLERITLSSDANVSMPTRDAQGRQVGLHNAPPSILHESWALAIRRNDLSLPEGLPLVTTNVARVLGLGGRKGRIAPGLDADLVCLDRDLAVRTVLCRGRVMVRDGRPVVKGPYEA